MPEIGEECQGDVLKLVKLFLQVTACVESQAASRGIESETGSDLD